MMKVVYKRDAVKRVGAEVCILKILAYFSVFNFPLSASEIRKLLPPVADADCIEDALENLVEVGAIFQIEDVYLLQNNMAFVKRKRDGHFRAEQLLPKAMKIGRFLSKFPYVKGIGISGGLSKMYAHEKADFDFFIITKSDRLWIARTFMHLFKKLTFITGKQHFFCMNYFLDEKALTLKDQNIYTAIEAITLIPVSGEGMNDFFKANSWVNEWFVGYSAVTNSFHYDQAKPWYKRFVEWLLNNKTGNRLDNYLMGITTRRWKKKEDKKMLNYEGKEMSLVTGKHFAWSNPDSFQEKIVELYDKKMNELKTKWPEYFQEHTFSFGE